MNHDAIYALNPTVITIRGDIAYDSNEQEVAYDMAQAQTKLAELQAQAEADAQAVREKGDAKADAMEDAADKQDK
jgi:hypothetical protein